MTLPPPERLSPHFSEHSYLYLQRIKIPQGKEEVSPRAGSEKQGRERAWNIKTFSSHTQFRSAISTGLVQTPVKETPLGGPQDGGQMPDIDNVRSLPGQCTEVKQILAALLPHVPSPQNQKTLASFRLNSVNSPSFLGNCLVCKPFHLLPRRSFLPLSPQTSRKSL